MKPIHSPADFQNMLEAERAIVFIFYQWSSLAGLARKTMAQWQSQSAGRLAELHCSFYELDPDGHPYTWSWMGGSGGHTADGERDRDLVAWLSRGRLLAFMPGIEGVQAGALQRVTEDCFVLGKAPSAESLEMLQCEPPPFDGGLLKILCCPETHQSLALAEASVVDKLNQRLAAGGLRNRAGRLVTETIEEGLVRADGRYLYPMRRNIPALLVEEAIPLER